MKKFSMNKSSRKNLQHTISGTILARLFMAILFVCANCISATAQDWHELYKKGQEYEKKSFTNKAMECYEAAQKLNNNDSIVRAIANCNFKRGYYIKCINQCQNLIEKGENSADLTLMAKCYEKMDMADSAVVYQKMLADREIENYSNIMSLAKNLSDMQEYDTAMVYLDRYYKENSTNLIVNTQRAYTLFQLNRNEEAIAEYEKLIKAGMNNVGICYYLGMAYSNINKNDKAYYYLYNAVDMSQRKNPYILAKFGAIAIETGLVVDGREAIEEAIEMMKPDSTYMYSLRYMQAKAYMACSDYNNALKYYKMSLKWDNSQYKVLYMMARAYGLKNNHKNEEKYLRMFVDKVKKSGKSKDYEKLLETTDKRLSELKVEKFFKGEND